MISEAAKRVESSGTPDESMADGFWAAKDLRQLLDNNSVRESVAHPNVKRYLHRVSRNASLALTIRS